MRPLILRLVMGVVWPTAVLAQAGSPLLRPGATVVLRVPPALLRLAPAGFRTTEARITLRPSGEVLVNGSAAWQGFGFASTNVFILTGVKAHPKEETLELQLERTERRLRHRIKIFISPAHTTTSLHQVLSLASDSVEVVRAAYDAVGRRLFGVVADSIPPPIRRRILEVADSMLAGEAVTLDSINALPYLELDSRSPETYVRVCIWSSLNDIYAAVLNDAVFPFVEMMSGTKSPLPVGFGFCVTYTFAVSQDGMGVRRSLTICTPSQVAAEFAAGRISRQELVDRSRVVHKGKTLIVDLAK